jgi:hypothetical protein
MARTVVNWNAQRDQYYVRPCIRKRKVRKGYRRAPMEAVANIATRIAIGVLLGLLLYCAAACGWFILTQMIPAERVWINDHIPTLVRHAIRDGILEKFFAVLGVTTVFVKPTKDLKKKSRPPFWYRRALNLRVTNRYQKSETTGRQFVFGLPSIYLFALPGLAVCVGVFLSWDTAYAWMFRHGWLTGINHVATVALSIPVVSFLWSAVITSIPKFVPSFLGYRFWGKVPADQLARDLQFLFVKLLVERNINLRWPIPANLRDLAADMQYERDRYGTIVDGPDRILGWAIAAAVLLLIAAGAGLIIVYVLAKYYVLKS